MTKKRVFLGIDGGGSKTAALVMDEAGHVLGTGYSGGSNHQTLGMETALNHIQQAATQALGGSQANVSACCLAGADMASDFARLEPAVRALGLAQDAIVYNDVHAVFRAGSTRPYGIAVVCGAGFNAGGIGHDGREVRLPALGRITGDCAGGYALGEAVIGAAFRAWDGRGKPTRLHDLVLETFEVQDMEVLAERVAQEQVTWQHVCDLAPLGFAAAVAGDSVAGKLIRAQGREIGAAILGIARRLNLLDTACEVVLGGSLFCGQGPLLIDTICATVAPDAPLMNPQRLDVKPVVGAALLALDHAGIKFDKQSLEILRENLSSELKI